MWPSRDIAWSTGPKNCSPRGIQFRGDVEDVDNDYSDGDDFLSEGNADFDGVTLV